MCGIIGYIGTDRATDVILDGLSSLEYRGYDSAGIAINDRGLRIRKAKGRLSNLRDQIEECQFPEGHVGIGHTRWATHGEPSDVNSHPHLDEGRHIAVVHNGIIENFSELREELQAKGVHFDSETDTEVIPNLMYQYYRQCGNAMEAIRLAAGDMRGSYALGVIFADDEERLYAVRKDSPLILGRGDGENFIASDIPAILPYTRDIYLLNDNEIAVLGRKTIEIYGAGGEKVEREIFHVHWDVKAAEKNGYEHFMLKEIFEQPEVVRATIVPRLSMNEEQVKLDRIHITKEELDNTNRIYIVACGTAYHAGLVGKYLLEKMARLPVWAETASEFRYRDPVLDSHSLVIVISQSGETADTLAALRMAKRAGARVMAIVNVVGSTMDREAENVLYTWAGPEIAVASTKAYSCQLAAMYLLVLYLSRMQGTLSREEFAILRQELYALPEEIQSILERAESIRHIVASTVQKSVFYIGRGLDYYASMEGSLKLKEIAYIHSEAYAAGELKHGPIAMIDGDTLVIGLITQQELTEKTVSNLKEVKARGAKVICIAEEGNEKVTEAADEVIWIPKSHPMAASLLANIVQQLFAYYMAVKLGNDVDKPRNLAKSVTVE